VARGMAGGALARCSSLRGSPAYPTVKGSRVCPESSTHTALTVV
jgi:hypothetical protein